MKSIEDKINIYIKEANEVFNSLNLAYEDYEELKYEESNDFFDLLFCYKFNSKHYFNFFVIEKESEKVFITSILSNKIINNINEYINFINDHRIKIEINEDGDLEVLLSYKGEILNSGDKHDLPLVFQKSYKENLETVINLIYQKILYQIGLNCFETKNNL